MKTRIFLIIISASVLLVVYSLTSRKPDATSVMKIGGVNLQIEIADSEIEKYQGLSGRDSLCDACGMIFVYDEPQEMHFVMRGMKFPLDMIFIAGGRIVEIRGDIPAPKAGQQAMYVTSMVPSDAVLEVNAGYARANSLQIGDAIDLIP